MMSPTKSPNDKRDYRAITLDNELKVLLISDLASRKEKSEEPKEVAPDNDANGGSEASKESDDTREDKAEEVEVEKEDEAEKQEEGAGDNEKKPKNAQPTKLGEKLAAAALCVGIGSFSDPDDVPGLAHFLEHMVFMGSEKYPDENAFDAYIRKHGGSDNALTDCEHTVFMFEIQGKYLNSALDRFAQFFISPRLNEGSSDREIEAVDSEFRLSAPSDCVRKQQLLGSLAKDNHLLNKFISGNRQTLKIDPLKYNIDVHKRLKQFHERYYSAHYMTLAVQAQESLDTLEKWVKDIFSPIHNNGLPKPSFSHLANPFDESLYHRMYKVIPVRKCLQVELHWSLPCLMEHYRVKPLHYLSWLIGHHGKGSIFSYLKKKVWALSLCSGNGGSGFEYNTLHSDFQIYLGLTDDGFAHVFEVITVIHQYLQMLRNLGAQEWLYKEIQTIDENNFRWDEEMNASEYVKLLAESMRLYPEQDYITGEQLMCEYNADVIEKCQNMLTPDKCCIMLTSPSYEKENICNLQEFWYRTGYAVTDIPNEWTQKWANLEPNDELSLPEVNRFIATDFELKLPDRDQTEYPVKLIDNAENQLWYKKDNKFNTPKAYVFFHLLSPIVNSSPESTVMFELFISLLQQNMKEIIYPAEMSQLSCAVCNEEKGLLIRVFGFNHKLPILFETILDGIGNFDVDEESFLAMKIFLRKGYYNCFIRSSCICEEVRLSLILQSQWTTVEKRKAIKDITKDKLLSFVNELKSRFYTVGLVQGNITAEEAVHLNSLIQTKLQYHRIEGDSIPENRITKLPLGEKYWRIHGFNKDDGNSVVTNYYQLGPGTIKKVCLMELLLMFMDEPCFNILRTQEQLGYSVYCGCKSTHGILGFTITVHTQTDKFSTSHVDERIEAFLLTFKEKLAATTEKDFETQVTSLIKLKECMDLNLSMEVNRNWSEIVHGYYVFDRFKQEVAALKKITLMEVQECCSQLVSCGDRSNFRKLGVHVVGHALFNEAVPDATTPPVMGDSGNNIHNEKSQVYEDDENEEFLYDFNVTDSEWTKGGDQCIVDIQEFKTGEEMYPVTKVVT